MWPPSPELPRPYKMVRLHKTGTTRFTTQQYAATSQAHTPSETRCRHSCCCPGTGDMPLWWKELGVRRGGCRYEGGRGSHLSVKTVAPAFSARAANKPRPRPSVMPTETASAASQLSVGCFSVLISCLRREVSV